MSKLVVDACVAIKWLLPCSPEESDLPQALALLDQLAQGEIEMYQPPHFIAEVSGVIARLQPLYAPRLLVALLNMEFQRVESSAIYATACDLAIRLNHHLFDTLYHAVALHEPNATLITADRRYYDKARSVGQITLLGDMRFV